MEYLALALFPFLFLALWTGVTGLLGLLAGWPGLARRFRTHQPVLGEKFQGVSGSIGLMNYRRCLSVDINEAGFGLAVWFIFGPFSKPLFIPWSEVASVEPKESLFVRYTSIRLRNPQATISLVGRPGERAQEVYARLNSPRGPTVPPPLPGGDE